VNLTEQNTLWHALAYWLNQAHHGLMGDRFFDPVSETPAESRLADELQRRLRKERTSMDVRAAEIRARWEAEDAAESTVASDLEEVRRAGWEQRARMLDQLRGSPLLPSTRADWTRRLEHPTWEALTALRADVGAYRASGGPLREALLGSFLSSFETAVDQLLDLCHRYDQLAG
jgi:hypothetical protein